jgi:PPOX class probable F420-dependent enzyme
MALDPTTPSDAVLAFLVERHLATLTTLRADGSPHVVAVGFTFELDGATGWAVVRVITRDGSAKVRHVDRAGADAVAAVAQVDGRRWLSLEGSATIERDPAAVADAEQRYARRYRTPRPNPERVVLRIDVRRMLGHA